MFSLSVLRRLARYIDVRGLDECWPWTKSVARGYGQISVTLDGHRRMWKVHRLVYFLCCCELPDGYMACHHCDNPICCNPLHLFAGTADDNNKDMVRKGRQIRLLGRMNPMWGKPGPMRGRRGESSPWFGKRHSKETKTKMVKAQLNRYRNEGEYYGNTVRTRAD